MIRFVRRIPVFPRNLLLPFPALKMEATRFFNILCMATKVTDGTFQSTIIFIFILVLVFTRDCLGPHDSVFQAHNSHPVCLTYVSSDEHNFT